MPAALTRHELDVVALQFFHQVGHDTQHRIFKFFGWEKKANGKSNGSADYPKLAEAKLKAMTTAEIGRFLVVCALASELYCPSYLSGATLSKDSKLAQEVPHYKVNADKLLREVKASLAKKSPRQIIRAVPTSKMPSRTGSDG